MHTNQVHMRCYALYNQSIDNKLCKWTGLNVDCIFVRPIFCFSLLCIKFELNFNYYRASIVVSAFGLTAWHQPIECVLISEAIWLLTFPFIRFVDALNCILINMFDPCYETFKYFIVIELLLAGSILYTFLISTFILHLKFNFTFILCRSCCDNSK